MPEDHPVILDRAAHHRSFHNASFRTILVVVLLVGSTSFGISREGTDHPPATLDSLRESSSYRTWTDSTGSNFSETVSTRMLQIYPAWSKSPLLLVETQKNLWDTRVEGAGGSLDLTLWRIPRQPGVAPIWARRGIYGNEGGILNDRLYRVVEWGCCGEEPPDTYYDLQSGLPLLESSTQIWTIDGLMSVPIYVGFIARMAGPPVNLVPGGGRVLGVLIAATQEDTLGYLRIWSKHHCVTGTGKLRLSSESTPASDTERIYFLANEDRVARIKLLIEPVCDDGSNTWSPQATETLHVALQDGRFDLSRAVVPEAFRVEDLTPTR